MYTPELTIRDCIAHYGTPTTKEAAPEELPLIIGMLLHMYLRLWTPNTTTSIDVRSLPYALQKSNHPGARAAMDVYKCSISPSEKITYVPSDKLNAVCLYYNLNAIMKESPLFEAVVQAVRLSWCMSENRENFSVDKILPDLSTGEFIKLTSPILVYTRHTTPCAEPQPLYHRYLEKITETAPQYNDGSYPATHPDFLRFIHRQKIGNLNPYCVVSIACSDELDHHTEYSGGADLDELYLLNYTSNEMRDDRIRWYDNMSNISSVFSSWSALYFLPMTQCEQLLKKDIQYTRHILSHRARLGMEAADDTDAGAADTVLVDENTPTDEYDNSATTTNNKPSDDLGVQDDTSSSDDTEITNNNVGERGNDKESIQPALKLYFLRQKIVKLFKLATEKGVAGPLLAFIPMLYLLDKTDLNKLSSRLTSALNRSQTKG